MRQLEGFRALLFCLAAAAVASCGTAPPSSTDTDATAGPSGAAPTTTWSGSPGSSGSPIATPDRTAACLSRNLAEMTEEQRVGQLFLLGVGGDRLSPGEIAAIETYHLGSTWLVNWRTGGSEVIRPLTAEIQALATESNTHGIGFLVGADQEGGQIQRLTGPGFSRIPSALEQGGLSTAILQADAAEWGRELKAAGVNLNFAPVMDVVPPGADATNAPIGALQREYGHDPTTVGSHGAAVIRGMAQAGIATTLKHFPGLGRVAGNTDTVAGVVDSTTTADDPYLEAFRAGIQAGAPFVMVSLATYSAIDPGHPAVFSSTIMGTLLRSQLGFDGVVVSDDLGAAASVSSLAPGGRATAFIAAGGDLMIVAGADSASKMAAAVLDRARSDSGFAAQVDAAAGRVLRAKQAYGLLSCS
jgi:beta-N-acetylhexosaminidase